MEIFGVIVTMIANAIEAVPNNKLNKKANKIFWFLIVLFSLGLLYLGFK